MAAGLLQGCSITRRPPGSRSFLRHRGRSSRRASPRSPTCSVRWATKIHGQILAGTGGGGRVGVLLGPVPPALGRDPHFSGRSRSTACSSAVRARPLLVRFCRRG